MTAARFWHRHLLKHPAPGGLGEHPGRARTRGRTVEHQELVCVGGPTPQTPVPEMTEAASGALLGAPAEGQAQVIAEHLPFARYIAARCGMPVQPWPDFRRVVLQGLGAAVEGFDPDCGVTFLGCVASAIQEQVRRHVVDMPSARVDPRGSAGLGALLPGVTQSLTRRLGRPPTVHEVAEFLAARPDDVVDAIDAADGDAMVCCCDAVLAATGGGAPLAVHSTDLGLGRLVDPEPLRLVLARLTSRDKQILLRRFLRGMGPAQISAELGVRPAQVDRVVSAFLDAVRGTVQNPPVRRHRTLRLLTAPPRLSRRPR